MMRILQGWKRFLCLFVCLMWGMPATAEQLPEESMRIQGYDLSDSGDLVLWCAQQRTGIRSLWQAERCVIRQDGFRQENPVEVKKEDTSSVLQVTVLVDSMREYVADATFDSRLKQFLCELADELTVENDVSFLYCKDDFNERVVPVFSRDANQLKNSIHADFSVNKLLPVGGAERLLCLIRSLSGMPGRYVIVYVSGGDRFALSRKEKAAFAGLPGDTPVLFVPFVLKDGNELTAMRQIAGHSLGEVIRPDLNAMNRESSFSGLVNSVNGLVHVLAVEQMGLAVPLHQYAPGRSESFRVEAKYADGLMQTARRTISLPADFLQQAAKRKILYATEAAVPLKEGVIKTLTSLDAFDRAGQFEYGLQEWKDSWQRYFMPGHGQLETLHGSVKSAVQAIQHDEEINETERGALTVSGERVLRFIQAARNALMWRGFAFEFSQEFGSESMEHIEALQDEFIVWLNNPVCMRDDEIMQSVDPAEQACRQETLMRFALVCETWSEMTADKARAAMRLEKILRVMKGLSQANCAANVCVAAAAAVCLEDNGRFDDAARLLWGALHEMDVRGETQKEHAFFWIQGALLESRRESGDTARLGQMAARAWVLDSAVFDVINPEKDDLKGIVICASTALIEQENAAALRDLAASYDLDLGADDLQDVPSELLAATALNLYTVSPTRNVNRILTLMRRVLVDGKGSSRLVQEGAEYDGLVTFVLNYIPRVDRSFLTATAAEWNRRYEQRDKMQKRWLVEQTKPARLVLPAMVRYRDLRGLDGDALSLLNHSLMKTESMDELLALDILPDAALDMWTDFTVQKDDATSVDAAALLGIAMQLNDSPVHFAKACKSAEGAQRIWKGILHSLAKEYPDAELYDQFIEQFPQRLSHDEPICEYTAVFGEGQGTEAVARFATLLVETIQRQGLVGEERSVALAQMLEKMESYGGIASDGRYALARARVLYEAGNTESAVEWALALLSADMDVYHNPDALYWCGRILLEGDEPQSALRFFERALRLADEDSQRTLAQAGVGISQALLGAYPQAVAMLKPLYNDASLPSPYDTWTKQAITYAMDRVGLQNSAIELWRTEKGAVEDYYVLVSANAFVLGIDNDLTE